MRTCDAPSERAARMNSSSFTFKTWARARRAYPAHPVMTSAMITLLMPGPRKAANAIAKRIPGNDKKCVDEQQIHDPIEPATSVTREHSDHEAGDSATADDGDRHHERDARAVNGARERVAPKFVSAHPVRSRRWLQAGRQILCGGICGCDPRREQRNRDEQRSDGKPDSRQDALAQKLPQLVAGSHDSLTRGSITEYKTSVSRLTST